jgi:hypothetical protein
MKVLVYQWIAHDKTLAALFLYKRLGANLQSLESGGKLDSWEMRDKK